MTHNVYSKLQSFLKKFVYPFGIIHKLRNKQKEKIYKHYFNYEKISQIVNNISKDLGSKSLINQNTLIKRRELEKIINSPTISMEDIILHDEATRVLVSDFSTQIKFLLNHGLNKLSKANYGIALSSLEDARNIKCSDFTIKSLVDLLIDLVKRNRKLRLTDHFTILYKE